MSQYRKQPKGAVLKHARSDTAYHDTNTKRREAYRVMKAAKAAARRKKK